MDLRKCITCDKAVTVLNDHYRLELHCEYVAMSPRKCALIENCPDLRGLSRGKVPQPKPKPALKPSDIMVAS